jgi:glycine cleavage system aminomethyltransferase T
MRADRYVFWDVPVEVGNVQVGKLTLCGEEGYEVHIPREVAVKSMELKAAAVEYPCVVDWDATIQVDAERA